MAKQKKLLDKNETQMLINGVWNQSANPGKLPTWLFDKIADGLTQAASEGWGNPLGQGIKAQDTALELAFQKNVFYFAARKTGHQLQELQNLYIAAGSKYEFAKQAIKLDDKWNYHWYNTEANTTQRLARSGREWQRLEATADIYPNLRFLAVQDGNARDDHQALHGIVKPVNDPFWQSYFPPLEWNCRCLVERVLEDEVEPTDIGDRELPPVEPQFNQRVTDSRQIWNQSHPYFDDLPPETEKQVEKIVSQKMAAKIEELEPEQTNGGLFLHKLDEIPDRITTAEEAYQTKEAQKVMRDSFGTDSQEFADDMHAKTSNYKKDTFFRYEGAAEGYAGVGQGLYLGQDRRALNHFYNEYGDRQLICTEWKVQKNVNWLNLMDPRAQKMWDDHLKSKGIDSTNSDQVGKIAADLGFDGIQYYDPLATGEEFVLFNTKKIKKVNTFPPGAVVPKPKPEPKPEPEPKTQDLTTNENIDKIKEVLKTNSRKSEVDGTEADAWLEAISELQGFDGKPQIENNTADFEAMKGEHIYRGVNGHHGFTEQFESGAYFGGRGIYGGGYYFASSVQHYSEVKPPDVNHRDALRLAKMYGNEITEAKLSPTAKVIEYNELKKIHKKALTEWVKSGEAKHISSKRLTESEAEEYFWMIEDPGRFAALKGYDAISVQLGGHNPDYIVVLNRTKVTVLPGYKYPKQ